MKKLKFLLLALAVASLGLAAQTQKSEPVKINPEICKTCKNHNNPTECNKARNVTKTCPQVKKQTIKSKKVTRKKTKTVPRKRK